MRIMQTGGLWKNVEDEIVKAAEMKYGKNNWDPISSLVGGRSGKKNKARWNEWLDPSIKKTEWIREEDEKLLHLAKLMPAQWRTIAPMVGRTLSQCLERYEKLLDAACEGENCGELDDPRKLRAGEIDPNQESRPARPDAVDMDEEEIQMLSEARARLANARGKKAKRKARGKLLEDARRIASLQKKRELKAAGIDNTQRKNKRKGIDDNAEILFGKMPPVGFYDVSDENQEVERIKFPIAIDEIEGEKRVDKEARLRQMDVTTNKIAQRHDATSAYKLNDPEAVVRKRPKINLPTPQISENELEHIAKFRLPEFGRRVDSRTNLHSGLRSLTEPKNKYEIVLLPVSEEDEDIEENIEEDMCDRIAREKAEAEQIKPTAILKNRISEAFGLSRNSLTRADEYKILKTRMDG